MMKKYRWVLGLITAVIFSIIFGGYFFLRSTLPDYDEDKISDKVSSEVEIIRDQFGMPHIYAENDRDAAFALGYAMAQDRLFQMELIRRAVQGRLSEVMGPKTAEVDILFRTITSPLPLDSMYAELDEGIKEILSACSDGINFFLASHPERLPFEFSLLGFEPEPYRPAEQLAGLYFMAWALNFSFDSELTRLAVTRKVGPEMAGELFFDYQAEGPRIAEASLDEPKRAEIEISDEQIFSLLGAVDHIRTLTGIQIGGASNNWVIGPGKSKTGAPILANDMHLGLMIPGIWYEAAIHTPEKNVSGVVLPGVPLIIAGANDHIAWGFTNVMADDGDYYLERINPDDSSQYLYNEDWLDFDIIYDTLFASGDSVIPFEIWRTVHGPLINRIVELVGVATDPIAMRWSIYDAGSEAEALFRLNGAENIHQIESAAALYKCPGQNWVYADDQGNIGFTAAVGIPRRENFDGATVMPGWDGRSEWSGYVATDKQPHLRNPEKGFIATANNKHTGDDYPYVISNCYAPSDRIIRIEQLLEASDLLDLDDMKNIQADDEIVFARSWVPRMVTALEGIDLSSVEKLALEEISMWDFHAGYNRAAPAIFHAMMQSMTESIFEQHLGDSLAAYFLRENTFTVHKALRGLVASEKSNWFDDPETEQIETLDSVFVKSFRTGVETLVGLMGDEVADWKWGDIHQLTFFHPIGRFLPLVGSLMNPGPFPMGGGGNSVNPSLYLFTQPWQVMAGASQRHIFDLGNMKNSLRSIPTGISGNFMSPHYDDQIENWLNVKYRPFHLDREDVENDALYRMVISPPNRQSN